MMLRWLSMVALCLVLSTGRAEAAMMVHYDLAGLILQSEAIVIAERLGPASTADDAATLYRITRSLRGNLKPGITIEIYDRMYDTRPKVLEPRAVLFLTTGTTGLRLVSSGLRVIDTDGKVFRFEQWNNPGPFTTVPQRRDPGEHWGLGGVQLDLAGLVSAITAAGRRVDALAAASALTDAAKRRASVLALFERGESSGGFFVDVFNQRAATALGKAGDLEGALLVEARSRGRRFRSAEYAKVSELVALAKDPSKTTEVRVAALELAADGFGLHEDHLTWRALAPLIEDQDPDVRAAAITAAASPASMTTSERSTQRAIDMIAGDMRDRIARRYAIEQDHLVLASVIEAYRARFNRPPPPRIGEPRVVAVPGLSEGSYRLEVYCTRSLRVSKVELLVQTADDKKTLGPFNASVSCRDTTGSYGGGELAILPSGTHALFARVVVAGSRAPIEIPLGSVVIEPSGERRLIR